MVPTNTLTFVKLPAVAERTFLTEDHSVYTLQDGSNFVYAGVQADSRAANSAVEREEAVTLFAAAPELLITLAVIYENADLTEEEQFMVQSALRMGGAKC